MAETTTAAGTQLDHALAVLQTNIGTVRRIALAAQGRIGLRQVAILLEREAAMMREEIRRFGPAYLPCDEG